jgi:hypothetical protein
MKIADTDRENIALLLETGNKLGAVRYIQQTFSMTAEEALGLAEKLDRNRPDAEETVRKRTPGRVAAVILTVTGFVLLSLGFFFGFRDYIFTSSAVPVAGKVAEIKEIPDGNANLYAPVIEYLWMGEVIRFEGSATESPAFVKGDDIQMLVDPQKPMQPRMDSFFHRWFVIVILAMLGLTFSVVGFFVRKLMT